MKHLHTLYSLTLLACRKTRLEAAMQLAKLAHWAAGGKMLEARQFRNMMEQAVKQVEDAQLLTNGE